MNSQVRISQVRISAPSGSAPVSHPDLEPEGPTSRLQTSHERRWSILAVLVLSLVMVVTANTVLNVALPTLARDLAATTTQLQWVVDAYVLVFAGLLLTAGAVGDRFGRKRALQFGIVVFGSSSVVSAFAQAPGQLVAGRAVMGVGAALIMPATLAILTDVFPPDERGRAIGIWAGFAGAGAALGPIAGGWLLQHFWWGATFLINLPLVLVALVVGRRLLPTSRDPHRSLDPVGALVSVVALSSLLYGIIEAPRLGIDDPHILGAFAVATVSGAGFVIWELYVDQPMLDFSLVRDVRFSTATIAIGSAFFAMFGVFFLLTQYLQVVLAYSPLEAGIRTLPMAGGLMVATPLAARIVERLGTRRVVGTGLLVTASGLLLASRLDAASGYGLLLVALIVMACGMGATAAPSTAAIMASVPQRSAGVGSAINDTTRELGGGLGVAILGSLATSAYASELAASLADAPPHLLAQATRSVAAAVQLSPGGHAHLAATAKDAFTHAMGWAFVAAAAMTALAGLAVLALLPRPRLSPSTSDDLDPTDGHVTRRPSASLGSVACVARGHVIRAARRPSEVARR